MAQELDGSYKEILNEMLDLALVGVPLNEKEEDLPNKGKSLDDFEGPEGSEDDTDDTESDDDEDSKDPEEELADSWEKEIATGGKFKIDIHENYIYVTYRSRRSRKIEVPPKLKPYRALYSSLFEKIMSHVSSEG